MKIKALAYLLLGSFTIVGIALAQSNNSNLVASAQVKQPQADSQELADKPAAIRAVKPAVINGAVNPELIPDTVAFSLMFRFISGNQSPVAKQRVRSYVKGIGTGDEPCRNCSKKLPDPDTDAIIQSSDEYQRRVSVLDSQAEQIKKNNPREIPPETMAQLAQLQRQKDLIISEIIASLPNHLSPDGLSRLKAHINLRVKAKTKFTPPSF